MFSGRGCVALCAVDAPVQATDPSPPIFEEEAFGRCISVAESY